MIRRTPFDIPLLLFLAAAGLGTYVVAWDVASAQAKLLGIVAGVAVYYALVWLPQEIGGRDVTHIVAIVAPVALGLFFLLTFDWSYRIGKVGFLDPIMRLLADVRLKIGTGVEILNSNSAGGLLAALLPFQAHALFGGRSASKLPDRSDRLVGLLLFGFSLLTLALSASRGGWIALGLVTLLLMLHKLTKRTWLAAAIFIGVCIAVWLVAGNWLLRVVAEDRLPVWTGAFDLATDYAFTGIGPANFAMPYASYVILSHVPYLSHAHNLYLDVWLEGGALGLVALLIVLVTVIRQSSRLGTWRAAAFACTAVVAVHGLLDDALYAYAPLAQVLMWIPLAMIARLVPTPSLSLHGIQAAAGACAVVLAVAVVAIPSINSVWQTNLGALAQTKLELPGYTYLEWGQQDKKRRFGELDYTQVRAHYDAALTLDANNAMANRRLAQIEIPFAHYDAARAQLDRAYAVAPAYRATRQMLGEMRAIAAETGPAVELWRTIDDRQNQLDMRLAWYRDFISDEPRAQRIADVLNQLRSK